MDTQGAVSSLLGLLGGLLVDETRLLSRVRRDLQFIMDEMETMNVNRYASRLNNPRGASCCTPLGLGRIARFVATISDRHRLATHIQELTARARDVGDRRTRYGGFADLPHQCPPAERPPVAVNDMPNQNQQVDAAYELRRILVDDDSDLFAQVAKELIDGMPAEESQDLKFIPILGLNGTGKTTLARKVHGLYGSMPSCKAFWISLGDDQSRKKVLESILQATIAPNVDEMENISSLQESEIVNRIIGRIKYKKFLLVLDDVRSESLTSDIGDVLSCPCSAGSGVLLVTSIPQVVNSCSPDDIVDFNDFPEHHRESLISFFLERAVSLAVATVDNSQDLRDVLKSILTKCSPSIFTMKMLLRCLFVKPHRNIEELRALNNSLRPPSALNANTMLNFCYRSLPIHYRNCLIYLAISPRDHTFQRTSLTRRWLAEGLISRRDVTSASEEPSEVANRCFDALCDHRFLLPAGDVPGMSRGGRIKSCTVHGIVLDFLSTILEDEGVVDEELFPHMAMRIFIQNILLQACSDRPLHEIVKKSDLHLLFVLDLESCRDFKDEHLKVICTKARHLKYLSLRNTGISCLPKQIHLDNLEMLDIRQTNVTALDIVLPMLKYLLAGKTEPSDESFSTVKLPRDISLMANMEVLSHVEVSSQEDGLIYLGRLKLRKLGVVFNRQRAHDLMRFLFSQIELLESCLRSLSIRIEERKGSEIWTSASGYSLIDLNMLSPPRLLETLSISGATGRLPNWIGDLHQLAKITLRKTFLTHDAIQVLGSLRGLRCLRFLRKALTEGAIIFREGKFMNLVDLLFEDDFLSSIIFDNGTAPKLERVVIKVSEIGFLHGIKQLPSLTEYKLSGHVRADSAVQVQPTRHYSNLPLPERPISARANIRRFSMSQHGEMSSATY